MAMNVQMMIFFIFALFLAPARQSMRGSIQGRVLNALNGQPVAGAQVSAAPGPAGLSGVVGGTLSAGAINSIPTQGATVIRSTSSAATIPPSGPAVTTGNDGKFSFTDLSPGTTESWFLRMGMRRSNTVSSARTCRDHQLQSPQQVNR